MEAKIGGQKYDEKQDICVISKVSPHKMCINYKQESSNFRVGKPGRQRLIQMVKISTTNTNTHGYHIPPETMH